MSCRFNESHLLADHWPRPRLGIQSSIGFLRHGRTLLAAFQTEDIRQRTISQQFLFLQTLWRCAMRKVEVFRPLPSASLSFPFCSNHRILDFHKQWPVAGSLESWGAQQLLLQHGATAAEKGHCFSTRNFSHEICHFVALLISLCLCLMNSFGLCWSHKITQDSGSLRCLAVRGSQAFQGKKQRRWPTRHHGWSFQVKVSSSIHQNDTVYVRLALYYGHWRAFVSVWFFFSR